MASLDAWLACVPMWHWMWSKYTICICDARMPRTHDDMFDAEQGKPPPVWRMLASSHTSINCTDDRRGGFQQAVAIYFSPALELFCGHGTSLYTHTWYWAITRDTRPVFGSLPQSIYQFKLIKYVLMAELWTFFEIYCYDLWRKMPTNQPHSKISRCYWLDWITNLGHNFEFICESYTSHIMSFLAPL